MKRIVILAALAISVLSSCANTGKIAIVAHRGYWKCEKAADSQNSIASLKEAQNMLCWGSECDIHLTADNKVIVNHDPTIGKYRISKTDFDVLSNCLLPNGETRPSFESYVKQAKKCWRDTKLVVELKKQPSKEIEDKLIAQTIDILKKNGMYNPKKVMFISFSLYTCKQLASIAKGFTNQYLQGDLAPAEVYALGINGIDYRYKVLKKHPEWVEEAHKLGMSVNVWTVNKIDDMKYFIDLGVDAITTNEPLALRYFLDEKEIKKR